MKAPPRNSRAPALRTRSAAAKTLLAALDGAEPGDDGQFLSAEGHLILARAHTNQRVLGFHLAAYQLVGLRNSDGLGNAPEDFKLRRLERPLVSGNPDGRALRPGHGMGAKAHRLNLLADAANVLFRRLRLHDDELGSCPLPLTRRG